MGRLYLPCKKDMNLGEARDRMFSTECLCPPEICVEALIPSVAVFGDGASKEVFKVELGHKGAELIQLDRCH